MAGKQKKNQKFDRNRKSPAMQAYKAQSRDQVNKKRKMAKHAKAVAAKAGNPASRGQLRAIRRAADPKVQERAVAFA